MERAALSRGKTTKLNKSLLFFMVGTKEKGTGEKWRTLGERCSLESFQGFYENR
jgi:hypothetical protein